MFGRFFKNKDDPGAKTGPPGHRTSGTAVGGGSAGGGAGGTGGAGGGEPLGGGFFNLAPVPVARGPTPAYSTQSPAPPGPGPGHRPSVPTYGAPQYGGGAAHHPLAHASPPPPPPSASLDMFGGMSIKANTGAYGGPSPAKSAQQPPAHPYGGGGGYGIGPHHEPPSSAMPPMPQPTATGGLFSGMEVASSSFGQDDSAAGAPPMMERKKSGTSRTGSFNYLDVAGAAADGGSMHQRASIASSTGSVASSRSMGSKTVKKKKTKTFRPGFGRQLSDESIAALQRGDLNEEVIMQQHIATDETEKPMTAPRVATNATDLAHLLPPVKSGSVLAGLTVHSGSSSSLTGGSGGGGVLAGLTVHGGGSASPAPSNDESTPDNGILAGLNVRNKPASTVTGDASTSVVLPSTATKKQPPPEPEKPPAPLTPEERLLGTLRDFHASAVNFRNNALKQNEEENRILERKVQLAMQLTQYEIDLRTIEAQQQQACEVEDFEKADALNATINSVKHCITLSESDVRKVDSELASFLKAKEKAFANQLRSTRGTLKELEKFREDQEAERSALRDEFKKYEVDQTEQLKFEAERIETELHHVSANMDHLQSEKAEIDSTIEEQCKNELALREQLLEEKAGVEDEIRELERQLKIKMDQMSEIQTSIDKAEKDIDTVRSRYSRQLKRIADREEGILKTKAEVEADAEHLEAEKVQFTERIQDYEERINGFGKRMAAVKKEMRAALLLANVMEVQEARREQAVVRKKQQTAELTALADAAAIAEQSYMMLKRQHDDLEKSLSVHRNAIASAEAMVPKLEQEKKAAAAQRNFKEAARISKDIKALEKDQSTAEEMVEVVEMELQDLKERIEKRGTEFEEKKEEQKTVEKQLELNSLQEMWKEAKALRTSLRKIEKLKSDSPAAADGNDFRSSALLLVQAEFDACMVQVEALEKKYGVEDPNKDDDVESEDEEDDDSVDDETVERLTEAATAAVDSVAENGDIEDGEMDGSSALEEISAKLNELEAMIEKATENEDYELAAKLDEKFDALKRRQHSMRALATRDAKSHEDETAHDSNVEDTEAPVAKTDTVEESGVMTAHDHFDGEVHDSEELENELRLLHARITMLEADIERATENEDYDTASALDDELQQLRGEESHIKELLAQDRHCHDWQEVEKEDGDELASSPKTEGQSGVNGQDETPSLGGLSMFAGLQIGKSDADNEDVEIIQGVTALPTSPVTADTVPEEQASELPVSPRRLSVGSGPNSPRRKSSGGMFAGLHVESVPSPRKSPTESMPSANSEQPSSVSMFDGLNIGSPTLSPHSPTNSQSMFAGMQVASNSSEEPSSLFSGMEIASVIPSERTKQDTNESEASPSAELEHHTDDAAVEVDGDASAGVDGATGESPIALDDIVESTSSSPTAQPVSSMFGGLDVKPLDPEASPSEQLSMFGGLAVKSGSDTSIISPSAKSDHEEPNLSSGEGAPGTGDGLFGGLSIATSVETSLDKAEPSEATE